MAAPAFGTTAGSTPEAAAHVTVAVRVKPLERDELESGSTKCVDVLPSGRELALRSQFNSRKFAFDHCFWSAEDDAHAGTGLCEHASQRDVYEKIGVPLLRRAWDGFNCSVFACAI